MINPFTGQKVLVDPTYKQFLSGLYYSAMTVPENYHRFLPKIATAIKPSGYLMTNGYHYHGRRYPCESWINKDGRQFSIPEITPKLSAYKQLCQTVPRCRRP